MLSGDAVAGGCCGASFTADATDDQLSDSSSGPHQRLHQGAQAMHTCCQLNQRYSVPW